MKLPWQRLGLLALPLVLGFLLGQAWHDADPQGSNSAHAQELKPDLPSKPQPAPVSLPASVASPLPDQPLPGSAPKRCKRVGSVVGLNAETMEQYILLHAHVWPEVLQQIHASKIRNYSIFVGQLDDGQYYLFSHFEYVGDDFDADMAAMANDPVTRDWWKLTDPLQRRVAGTPVGDQWKTMKEVFHTD